MARDTLAHAKAEVFALLGDNDNNCLIANIAAAYRHDPGQSLTGGPIVASLQTVGMDPNHYLFELRLYCDLGSDALWVQDALDGAINDIELALQDWFDQHAWSVEPHPDLDSWTVARRLVQVIRDGPGRWQG